MLFMSYVCIVEHQVKLFSEVRGVIYISIIVGDCCINLLLYIIIHNYVVQLYIYIHEYA